MSTLNAKIQVLSNTTTNLTTTNATYETGRIVYETDTGKFKIGNGTANWTNLLYHPHDTAEMGAYGRCLEDAEVDQLEQILKLRYGLTY